MNPDSDPDPQHWNDSLLYHENPEVLDFESETVTEQYMSSKQRDPELQFCIRLLNFTMS
jgi:hypothetical protein